MAIEIKVPEVGESIREVQISQWLRHIGDQVEKDEDLVEIDSEKASVQLPAPESGTLKEILKKEGEMADVGEIIGYIDDADADAKEKSPDRKQRKRHAEREEPSAEKEPESAEEPARATKKHAEAKKTKPEAKEEPAKKPEAEAKKPEPETKKPESKKPSREVAKAEPRITTAPAEAGRDEEIVPMSMLRRSIAQRLVEAQHTAAILSTFNEIDMSAVIGLRNQHREAFQAQFGVKLGFMSFFIKASIEGLKRFPQVNAEIREEKIVYHNYYDIGVAIGGGKGLVVPVLMNADRLSFAEIEQAIADFAERASENRLRPDELQGGTFTITNGGIYGSLLSTPIINPPQSGILGMHAIQDRPVARDGQVVIRPMMYVALSYDHRLVDGREAVGFLRRVKEVLEDPPRLFLEV